MKPASRLLMLLAASASLAGFAAAQSLISAKSGTVHYTEGRVLLNGKPAEIKYSQFPQMNDNAELRTEEGRAEILLTPGVVLRVAENTAVRMVSNRLTDTRLEVIQGSALFDCTELLKDNSITVLYQGATIALRKHGLYRVDSEPPSFRVYDGEAEVEQAGEHLVLKDGRVTALNGALLAEKFNNKAGDALFRWSGRRAEYLAMANISAARSIRESGYSWNSSGWSWNPYFGMYTFIPQSGFARSFWGYSYWSPRAVMTLYQPRPVFTGGGWNAGRTYNSNLGYSTVPHTASGTSGTVAARAPAAAPAASSAPISRGSSQGGGRGR